MKKILVFLVIAGLICACGNAEDAKNAQASAFTAEKAENGGVDGEKIYKQYCITCHGLYGDMGAAGAFDLSSSELSVEERVQVITGGRNAMASFRNLLSKEKIEAVAKHTMALKKKADE